MISAVLYLIMFGNVGKGVAFAVVFLLAVVSWDFSYGIGDIAYGAMLLCLTPDERQRQRNTLFSRTCAEIGQLLILVSWEPLTRALGDTPQAWATVAAMISAISIFTQSVTVFGVRDTEYMRRNSIARNERVRIRDALRALRDNDQLGWIILFRACGSLGYFICIGCLAYYMQYIFGDRAMYAYVSIFIGFGKLAVMMIYPRLGKLTNRQIYALFTVLTVTGNLLMFFSGHCLPLIVVAAVLTFAGNATSQVLGLLFITESVDYGQWKTGRRDDSLSFSVYTISNKISSALASGAIGMIAILAGIKSGTTAALTLSSGNQLVLKLCMLAFPALLTTGGYWIYRSRYILAPTLNETIRRDLELRAAQSQKI